MKCLQSLETHFEYADITNRYYNCPIYIQVFHNVELRQQYPMLP